MTIITFYKIRKFEDGGFKDVQETETLLELDDPMFGDPNQNPTARIESIINNMRNIDNNIKPDPWPYIPMVEVTDKLNSKFRHNSQIVTLMITSHTHFNVPYFEKKVIEYNRVNHPIKNKAVIVFLGVPNNFDGNQRNFFNEYFLSAQVTDRTFGFAFKEEKAEIKQVFQEFASPENIIMSSVVPTEMEDLAPVVINKLLYTTNEINCECPKLSGKPVAAGNRCEILMGECGPEVEQCTVTDTDNSLCEVNDASPNYFKCNKPTSICNSNPCKNGGQCLGNAENNIQADIMIIAHGSVSFDLKVGANKLVEFIENLFDSLDVGWPHNARFACLLADQSGSFRHRPLWPRFSTDKKEMNLDEIVIEPRTLAAGEVIEFGFSKTFEIFQDHGREGAHCVYLILSSISDPFSKADNHGSEIFQNQELTDHIQKCNVHVININLGYNFILETIPQKTLTTILDASELIPQIPAIKDAIYRLFLLNHFKR